MILVMIAFPFGTGTFSNKEIIAAITQTIGIHTPFARGGSTHDL